jgi:hydrogenase 3 maturation protease
MPNQSLKSLLKKSLENAKKVAVLGVGSELRADDVAGMLVAQELLKLCKKNGGCPQLEVFLGSTAPENLTGEIKKCQPSHLIIIDAADISSAAGAISLIDPKDIAGISFSTHQMPLSLFIDYIQQSCQCRIIVMGIQPKVLQVGQPHSKEVEKSVKQVAKDLAELISAIPQ